MDDATYILNRVEQLQRDYAGYYFEDFPEYLKKILHSDKIDEYLKTIDANENISYENFTTFLHCNKSRT